ncbi:MAG: IS3 family transposase [Gudongella sp.]|nr:IS3 family transposase [Gudongella sp.]
MYTYEERIKAVKLLIQYDMSYATVIRELEYPSRRALRDWYKEYLQEGNLHQSYVKKTKFSEEEMEIAVKYYLEHGKSVSRTVKKLGYPSRPVLDKWILERAPDEKRYCRAGGSNVKYTREQKEKAVISLCSRNKPTKEVAEEHGVTRESLYNWKRQLLKGERVYSMGKGKPGKQKEDCSIETEVKELRDVKENLSSQIDELQKEVHRLKIERDIYEKAAEIIKKDQGISIQTLTNHEKAIIINALRKSYQLKDLLEVMSMAKSSYCYQAIAVNNDKYADLRIKVIDIFEESKSRYGYRRVHSVIKNLGITVSEKVVRMIMKDENLVVPNIKRKKYSSYKGEISPEVENVVNRDFHADKPNSKWLTDITEFHIPAGKIYLSPIIDCFDGLPVSWAIGTSPSAELVNTMLDEAILMLNNDEKPIVHSDRGCHYRWPGWLERIEKAQLIRSMSKKGCSPDNAACEGFFSRLKNEMFYGHSWTDTTIAQFIEELNEYIKWYSEERIKLSLGGMSPVDYRRSLGLAI